LRLPLDPCSAFCRSNPIEPHISRDPRSNRGVPTICELRPDKYSLSIGGRLAGHIDDSGARRLGKDRRRVSGRPDIDAAGIDRLTSSGGPDENSTHLTATPCGASRRSSADCCRAMTAAHGSGRGIRNKAVARRNDDRPRGPRCRHGGERRRIRLSGGGRRETADSPACPDTNSEPLRSPGAPSRHIGETDSVAEDAVLIGPVSTSIFLLTGKLTGNFANSRPSCTIFASNQKAYSMACRKIRYATEQGNNRGITGNFFKEQGIIGIDQVHGADERCRRGVG
jgi:hypothetical protein